MWWRCFFWFVCLGCVCVCVWLGGLPLAGGLGWLTWWWEAYLLFFCFSRRHHHHHHHHLLLLPQGAGGQAGGGRRGPIPHPGQLVTLSVGLLTSYYPLLSPWMRHSQRQLAS